MTNSNLLMILSSISFFQRNQPSSLQQSLIGSILANILLLPALSIFYSAYHNKNLSHNLDTTRIKMMMMVMAVSAFLIPTVFITQVILSDISVAQVSRGIAIILALIYAAYLVFEFYSHEHLFVPTVLSATNNLHSETRSVALNFSSQTACQVRKGAKQRSEV